MALTINSSIASINAQRQLTKNTNALTQTFQRLSSGLRVNSAKDDAAGLAIVTRMSAQIRGMNTASRNANDGISLLQVAEGALEEVNSALQRMRELAVQSANATYTDADRTNLNTEFSQLISEVDRISKSIQFNGKPLLGGSTNGVDLKANTSFSGTFQVGANAGQTLLVTINRTTISKLSLTNAAFTGNRMGISAQSQASKALSMLENVSLAKVNTIRANLGAMQARFESIITNLANVVENTDAARSRIQDADIALETSNLTKNTILQQAGVAILAQANQQPSIALTLLTGR